jgi:hypothetical protein
LRTTWTQQHGCISRWRDILPDDKDLKKYRQWLEETNGQGTGLERHRTMLPG